jgi:hypothetical protein
MLRSTGLVKRDAPWLLSSSSFSGSSANKRKVEDEDD